MKIRSENLLKGMKLITCEEKEKKLTMPLKPQRRSFEKRLP